MMVYLPSQHFLSICLGGFCPFYLFWAFEIPNWDHEWGKAGARMGKDRKSKWAEASESVESEGFGGFWHSCVDFCLHVKSKRNGTNEPIYKSKIESQL